uniref:Uncharacterized protein n=1 Tax=Anguilla anguilla TaxID=7936 RepID=A0A0E9X6P6_ANGAN
MFLFRCASTMLMKEYFHFLSFIPFPGHITKLPNAAPSSEKSRKYARVKCQNFAEFQAERPLLYVQGSARGAL